MQHLPELCIDSVYIMATWLVCQSASLDRASGQCYILSMCSFEMHMTSRGIMWGLGLINQIG